MLEIMLSIAGISSILTLISAIFPASSEEKISGEVVHNNPDQEILEVKLDHAEDAAKIREGKKVTICLES